MRPTIYDVAKHAGVSISTVSLVLNKPDRVKEDTRQKILSTIDAIGYLPKADAVQRARKGTGRIGVLGPFTSYASYRNHLVGIVEAAKSGSFEIVLFDTPSAMQSYPAILDALPITGRVDGLVILSIPMTEIAATRITQLGLPTVLVDSRFPGFDSVFVDNYAGGEMAADYLQDRGFETFCYFGESSSEDAPPSQTSDRQRGFADALARHGYLLSPTHTVVCRNDVDMATASARNLIERIARPFALFAGNDLLAAGAIRAARHLGLRVPEDIAILGFDDGDLAAALDLSSIRQPLVDMGQIGFQLLAGRLESAKAPQEIKLGLEIVQRSSS